MNKSKNFTEFVLRYADVEPEKVAIDEGNSKIRYGELKLMVNRLAVRLYESGMVRGDAVILMAEDELLLLLGVLSVSALGGVYTVLRRSMLSPLFEEKISIFQPKFFLVDNENIKLSNVNNIVLDRNDAEIGNSVNQALSLRTLDSFGVSECDVLSLIMGSGSTGRPKIISVTHIQEISNLETRSKAYELSLSDHVGTMTHLEFTSARRQIFCGLSSGCTVKLFKKTNNNFFDILYSDVSVLSAPVVTLHELSKRFSKNINIFKNLRILSVGGTVVSEDIRLKIDNGLTEKLHVVYGTNELGFLAMAKPEQWRGLPASIGKPLDGIEMEIVDWAGNCVPSGRPGLMRFRKKKMIQSYFDSKELTDQYFRDGWFYPGDIGKLDSSGNIIYIGRADDMMIFNGINIYPSEIEAALFKLPGIKDAVALPMRHDAHHDVPVCVVVLEDGVELDKSFILNWCHQLLGSVGPKNVFFVKYIPRNEQGKLLRPQLKHLLLSMRNEF